MVSVCWGARRMRCPPDHGQRTEDEENPDSSTLHPLRELLPREHPRRSSRTVMPLTTSRRRLDMIIQHEDEENPNSSTQHSSRNLLSRESRHSSQHLDALSIMIIQRPNPSTKHSLRDPLPRDLLPRKRRHLSNFIFVLTDHDRN